MTDEEIKELRRRGEQWKKRNAVRNVFAKGQRFTVGINMHLARCVAKDDLHISHIFVLACVMAISVALKFS